MSTPPVGAMDYKKGSQQRQSTNPRQHQKVRVVIRFGKLPVWLQVLSTKIQRFAPWRGSYPIPARVGWASMALLILFTLCVEVFNWGGAHPNYILSSKALAVIGESDPLYAPSLELNTARSAYEYNQGYQPGVDVAGQSGHPKFVARFSKIPKEGATVTDPVNQVSVTFKPEFSLAEPVQDQNRLVYPLPGRDAQKVYSLKGSGLKEDIVLNTYQGDELSFAYSLELSPGTEARIEHGNLVSIYGVDPTLLGKVTTGTQKDSELLEKALANGKKNTLLFRFPAPFIVESGKKGSKAKAWYTLESNRLTLHAAGLKAATYPLSIDPTVYVETAAKLMRGNNETNVDFDVTNELIQKGSTTGARFDDWASTMSLNQGRWEQGTAVAGGYMYSVGGTRTNLVTQTYSTAGNNTFVVPSGITSVTVKMWGGGGGGGGGGSASVGGNGGGGGFTQATLAVTPAESLTVRVGGGGGLGTGRSDSGDGGGGGGHSEVERSGTSLIIAAGGGGGGGGDNNSASTPGGSGGAGGGTSGVAGGASSSAPGGGEGTSGAGGAAGNGAANDGVAGSAEAGGDGADGRSTNGADGGAANGGTATGGDGGTGSVTNNYAGAGGGGSGLYGGGGGAGSVNNNAGGGGGGGGSSYTTGTATTNTAGSGVTPGNANDTDRSGAGTGGNGGATTSNGTAGAVGRVIITYVPSGSSVNEVRPEVYWAHISTANPEIVESPNPGAGYCTDWCTDAAYNLPDERSRFSLVAYNGFLYAMGGIDSTGTKQSTVYVAKLGANGEPAKWHPNDTNQNNWVYWYSTTSLSAARSYTAAVAYNNRMYLLGGLASGDTTVSTVEVANINPDGTLSSWSTTGMSSLPTARYGHTVHVYNDRIYLVGGNGTFTGTPVATVHYAKLNNDGTMNSWMPANDFGLTGRMTLGGSFSTIWGAYLYLSGGCSAVNGSGYCTAVESDVKLVSINADGSLASWGTIANVTNQRIGYGLVGWRNTLYRVGGCSAQSPTTGDCTSTLATVDLGEINPDGDASTVSISEASGSGNCTGGDPYGCDLPPAGDAAGEAGYMLSATAVMNGFLYSIGGCAEANGDASSPYDCSQNDGITGNVTYAAISSDGSLRRPASCVGSYYGSWCVDSTNRVNSTTGVAAAGVTVFGGRIYVVGGLDNSTDGTASVYSVRINADGSLAGAWDVQTLANVGVTGELAYTYAYARANPSSAGTYPGNLYVFGGCGDIGTGVGCSGGNYRSEVYKCNIEVTGLLEEDDANDCTTTGQLQIDSELADDTNQGLGIHSGTVYANYIYLIGGFSAGVSDRDTVFYAKFDNSNNVVDVESGTVTGTDDDWIESPERMAVGRRRGASFGYNGYIYALGGFDGGGIIDDIEYAKVNVSDGSIEAFDTSAVVINQRWGLSVIVSSSYAYVIGGCNAGASPGSCTSFEPSIQTFQIYNNESGAPALYGAGANLFSTDRLGASSAILNGYIYVAGGCTTVSSAGVCTAATDNVQYAALDAYGAIGSWSNTSDATLPGQRAFGQLEAVGGTLYYVGGQGSTATDESADVYYGTPSSGNVSSWADATNDLPAARTQHGAAVWNGRIYVTGGLDSNATPSTVIYASPDLSSGGDISSAWTATGMTSFNVARSGHTTVAYANNLYVFGGYDGTNYLNDSQFTQINSNGTLDAWTYTTSLPTAVRGGDGFAANGYMYVIGGRSSDNVCTSKTLVAPIGANTTIASGNNPTGIGEWYETNGRYTGDRYGNSAVYSDGKAYVLGGACSSSTAPAVSSVTTTNTGTGFATDSTSHAVNMPGTTASGDLLLMLFSTDDNATVTDPDGAGGWTEVATQTTGSGGVRGSVWAKVATGSDGATVTFTTSATESASAQVYRILAANWYGDITNGVAASSGTTATTQNPDPPSLDPSAWGTESTLWLAYSAGGTYTSVTSYPANFTDGTHQAGNTGTNGASTSSARRTTTASSEDPGTFTMNASNPSVTFTVAVRPSFTYTGSNRVTQTALLSQPQVARYSRMIDTDTDVFPTKWLLNGIDNSIGARWNLRYRSMNDTDGVAADCGSADMTTWGQETNFGEVTLSQPENYVPYDGSGNDIDCARYFYFAVTIDSSQTFGYPEDINRGPTINDLSLFFTSDPSKRLRHGKTFTGGEQQPFDTPF